MVQRSMVAANKERSRDDMVRLHRGELNGSVAVMRVQKRSFSGKERTIGEGAGRTGLMPTSESS